MPPTPTAQDKWLAHPSIGVHASKYPTPAGPGQQDAPPAAAQAGSDKQSQEFQAAFNAQYNAINTHLAYTATNADPTQHNPLASKRNTLAPAYQAALGKVDADDPKKAKAPIDKVLATAKALNAEVSKFRAAAEKAFNDWQSRHENFDTADSQLQDLEAWEEPKAVAMRASEDGIATLVGARKYAEACTTLDKLLPKLKPVYDEYLKQKAAKDQYDPALAAIQQELSESEASSYVKLQPAQKDMASIKSRMEKAAGDKIFVDALNLVQMLTSAVKDYETKRAELDKQKKAYEDALEPLKSRLEIGPQPHAKLEPMHSDINSVRDAMEVAVKAEEYEAALGNVRDLKAKLDAWDAALKELEEQKKAFDDFYEPVKKQLAEDDDLNKSTTAEMAPLKKEILEMQAQIDKSAQAEEYDDALKLATALKKNYEDYKNADKTQQYLVEIPKGNCKGKYLLTAQQLVLLKMELAAVAAENGIPPLKQKAEFYSGWYSELEKVANDFKIISAVVNFAGGASLPAVKSAVDAQQASIDALVQAVASNLSAADTAYRKAIETINQAGSAIKEYMDKTESGGNTVITVLQYVEGTCFAIAAVAGGAALAGAGAGLAATAGANVLSGAAWEGFHSAVDSAAHNAIMTGEKPITTEEMEKRAALAAAKGGAEGLLNALGGQLAKGAGPIAEKLILKMGCTSEPARKLITECVTNGMGEAFKAVLKNNKEILNGNWDQVWPKILAAFIEGILMGSIKEKLHGESAPKFIVADQNAGKALDTYFEKNPPK